MAWELYTEVVGRAMDIRYIDKVRRLVVQYRRPGRGWSKNGPRLCIKSYTGDPVWGKKDILFEFRAWDNDGIYAYLTLPSTEMRVGKMLKAAGNSVESPAAK